MRYYHDRKIYSSKLCISLSQGFALPTVLILSLTLLILGLSAFQVGLATTQALNDQQWNRVAQEAAQAGVNYATSCLGKADSINTSTWSSLSPATDCKGTSNGSSVYYAQASSGETPNWRATFTVSAIASPINGKPRSTVMGKLELIGASNVVTKTYTSSTNVLLNITTSSSLTAKKVMTSGANTCVIASDNQAYCSGYNNYGQLGDGTTTNQPSPVKFQLPSGLKAVDMRLTGSASCVLASDKQLYCYGYNTDGKFGDGTRNNTTGTTPAKFNLPAGVSVREIPKHNRSDATCVIASDEKVYCAGINANGEFGNGTTTYYQSSPTAFCGASCSVANLNGSNNRVTFAHVGSFNNICVVVHIVSALTNLGYCAGYNASGQLGDGTTVSKSTPTLFGSGSAMGGNIYQIASNNGATCAIAWSDDKTYCSGTNGSGQLADGTTTGRITPVPSFSGSPSALKTFSYYSSTCTMFMTTELYCSGDNNYGKLGNGTTGGSTVAFTRYGITGGGVKDFDIGSLAICALTIKQDIYCSGWNGAGEFGNGNTTNNATPQKYNLPSGLGVVSWSFTDTHVCAVATDDQAYCAGRNDYGQIGDGTTTLRSTPVKFSLPSS